MISNQLINELGLLNLVSKHNKSSQLADSVNHQPDTNEIEPQAVNRQENAIESNTNPSEKMDKNEFRLLVKMLQAINHECQYDHIEYNGKTVKYNLNSTTLVFNDINVPDAEKTINLSSLSDLLRQPNLKRAVWEKLKTIL